MAETKEIKRTYTIPLRRGYANTPRYKRTNKAVRVLKKYLVKHMKSEKIKLGPALNETLWANGIKNPPARVVVDVTKDANNVVRAELTGVSYVDFKQQEKVEAPKNLQDKLKKTVEEAKAGKEEKATEEKPAKAEKTESKPAEKKTETKKEEKPAEKKAESKPVEESKKTE